MFANLFCGTHIIGTRHARLRGAYISAVRRWQQGGKLRRLEIIEQPEAKQRPITATSAFAKLRIQGMSRFIGQVTGNMFPRSKRRTNALQRRKDLFEFRCDDEADRLAIQSRRSAAQSRIVEQNEHRTPLLMSRAVRKPSPPQ